MIAALKDKNKYKKFIKDFKFAFYCLTHPLDGYWDLTHEKRGSVLVATVILLLVLVARLMFLGCTSFLFVQVNWARINIFTYIASIIFPLALFVVGNWALTTLFDGKGRLMQIYTASCYSMLPYALITIPLSIVSNVLSSDFAEVVGILSTLSLVWSVILFICSNMQIHEFSLLKTLLFIFATIIAMAIMIFILLLFFSMISEGVSYFVSIYKEIMYRVG
ncbi:MAG: YIP1 family protein [Lachnospiraceae bacterium]|nr:YIP1 family protein [Lachnospiraceae bacterium]